MSERGIKRHTEAKIISTTQIWLFLPRHCGSLTDCIPLLVFYGRREIPAPAVNRGIDQYWERLFWRRALELVIPHSGHRHSRADGWIDHGSKNTPLVYFARFYAQALLNALPRGARRDDRRLSDLLRARHYYNVSYEVLCLAVPGCFIPCRIPVRDDNSDVDNWENVRHVALILNLDRSVIAL